MPALPTPLKADGSISVGADVHIFNRTAGAWVEDAATQVTASILDSTITSAVANGDTAVGISAAVKNTTVTSQFSLTDTPADFLSMDSLSCRFSTAIFGTYSDDGGFIDVRVYESGGATVLAGAPLVLARRSPLINVAYNQTFAFTNLNTTATKTQWDNAYIEIHFGDVQIMGPDGASLILVDFELTGAYTAAIAAKSTSPVRRTSFSHLLRR